MRRKNEGFSLIELIIVIAIMVVLIGIIAPQFVKYVTKARKARDITTADRIASVVQTGFATYPDAYDTFIAYGTHSGERKFTFTATVNGVVETYEAYPVMVNEKNKDYVFYGTMPSLKELYKFMNEELGLRPNGDNTFINPRTKVKKEGKNPHGKSYGTPCCWRIMKRADNDQMEIWAADSVSWGGWPVYRVWPEPDDVYR